MVFPMVYCLVGVGICKFGVRGSYPYFWASYYIQDFYTIGESLTYFFYIMFCQHSKIFSRSQCNQDPQGLLRRTVYCSCTLHFNVIEGNHLIMGNVIRDLQHVCIRFQFRFETIFKLWDTKSVVPFKNGIDFWFTLPTSGKKPIVVTTGS